MPELGNARSRDDDENKKSMTRRLLARDKQLDVEKSKSNSNSLKDILARNNQLREADGKKLSDAEVVAMAERARLMNSQEGRGKASQMNIDELAARNAHIVAMAGPLYEKLNRSWERAEEFFKSRGILAPVALSYGGDDHSEELIGIQRISGKWRICVGYLHYSDPDQNNNWTPICESSVELRSSLLTKIPQLFERLVKTNEEVIPRLEKAVIEAEYILNSFGVK